MKRRSLLLIILIVLLPIALLTWFGLRMATDEQMMVRQRYRSLMEQRLEDVNRTISQRFEATERRLQQITSVDEFDLQKIRNIVRTEPQVTQLFVLSPDGDLLYPNPAEQLNGTEQSFLRQASRMFTDRDLQNAVAFAEAGSAEQSLARTKKKGVSQQELLADAAVSGMETGQENSLSPGSRQLSLRQTGPQQPTPRQPNTRVGSWLRTPELPIATGDNLASAGVAQPFSADAAPRSEALPEQSDEKFDPLAKKSGDFLAESDMGNTGLPVDQSANQARRVTIDQKNAPAGIASPNIASPQNAPASGALALNTIDDSPALPPAVEVEMAQEVADSKPDSPIESESVSPTVVPSISQTPPPQRDLRESTMESMAFEQSAAEVQQSSAYPASRGWFVWYWDRGMNLVYWQRRPSGHIVGAALERARWIADLISWLPESTPTSREAVIQTTFRVVTSSAESVYSWGGKPMKDERPYCEMPLAAPLASWRLQCFVPVDQISTGRSAFVSFGTGLAAFALTITAMAWLLYRDFSRDMRDASQQVSFVNQVSHELKTPLTNIRMYAELLGRDLEQVASEQSTKPLRRLEVINSEAQRLSRLIGNVLTFARQHRKTLQVNPTEIDATTLVAQIADRFSPALQEKQITVELEGKQGQRLLLDEDFVEQILGNLISNVEKYASSGKLLKIRTEFDGTTVTIDVIDSGPGIPKAHRASVFKPFERLNNDLRASTGTGIGLSIARDLARLHGGDLTLLDSAAGCWFRIELEAVVPPTE